MNKTASGVTSAFSASMKKVGSAIGLAFSTAAVISFGKKCVQIASETQSAWVGLNSILNGQGKSFSQANSFIQQYISDGLVPLNNAVTAYKNLAARGYSTEQIEQTLTALKDAAAFGRAASYSYGEAIQSATEGLKNENSVLVDNAGVTKNVAKMWDDYAKSIGTTANNLTQQQKIQAEVAGVMQETKWQTGDAAKYSDTFAGRIAKLTATFTRLKTTIGNVIVPILNLFLPAIQTAMDALSRFLAMLQSVMAGLGLEMPDVSSLSSVTTSAVEAATAIESTGTATETAAKKAKKSFASFDEINVLNKSSADISAMGSSSAAATAALPSSVGEISSKINLDTAEAEGKLSGLKIIIDKVKEKFDMLKAIDFSKLKKSIGNLWGSLKKLGGTVWTKIEKAYDKVLVPLAKWTIEESVPAVLNVFSGALDILTNVITSLQPLGQWFWDNFLKPLAEWTGDALTTSLEWLATKLTDISIWISENQNTVENLAILIGSVSAALLVYKGYLLAVEVASKLWTVAQLAVNAAMTANPIGLVVAAIGALIGVIVICVKHWDEIKAAAVSAWEKIKETWQFVKDWFRTKVTEPISNFFTNLWSDLKTSASNAWQNIKNAFSSVGSFFSGIWNTIKSKFTDIGQKIGDSVGGAFKTAVNAVLTTIENVANTPINAINKLLDIINEIPGIDISKLDTFDLPRLAQGGWVAANNPQLAIVGDNRREGEIIAPESKIREAVAEALKTVGNSTTVQTVKLAIELIIKYPDGRTVIKQINEAQIAEGRILLEV